MDLFVWFWEAPSKHIIIYLTKFESDWRKTARAKYIVIICLHSTTKQKKISDFINFFLFHNWCSQLIGSNPFLAPKVPKARKIRNRLLEDRIHHNNLTYLMTSCSNTIRGRLSGGGSSCNLFQENGRIHGNIVRRYSGTCTNSSRTTSVRWWQTIGGR